ncbi:MAG: hypothetical protein M3552_13680, partial [Planctomycetota bacterium]|nr:hypothetical protein [Planctomycetota bacterium]
KTSEAPMTYRRRWRLLLVLFIAAFSGWFLVREVRDRRHREQAFPVVKDLGGRIGSIPFWTVGDEIRITFADRSFAREELARLVVLEPLTDRHWVGVAFRNTNLTDDDVEALGRIIPNCFIMRVVDNEIVQRVKGETSQRRSKNGKPAGAQAGGLRP